jgi:Clathrin adaptor complex small chain
MELRLEGLGEGSFWIRRPWHWISKLKSDQLRKPPAFRANDSIISESTGDVMVLSFILIQNRQGKTRLAKWYAPYTDEEKVKLKGEVCSSFQLPSVSCNKGFLPPLSSVSNNARNTRFIVLLHLATRSTNQTSSSSDPHLHPLHPRPWSAKTSLAPRSSIEDMQASSSASASTPMTMSWLTWRLYISLLKC